MSHVHLLSSVFILSFLLSIFSVYYFLSFLLKFVNLFFDTVLCYSLLLCSLIYVLFFRLSSATFFCVRTLLYEMCSKLQQTLRDKRNLRLNFFI